MASSSDSEKERRAPDKTAQAAEDHPNQSKGSGSEVRVEGSGTAGSEERVAAQGSRVEAKGSTGSAPKCPEKPEPPQEPEEEMVEVTVEVEPPWKPAKGGKGSIGKHVRVQKQSGDREGGCKSSGNEEASEATSGEGSAEPGISAKPRVSAECAEQTIGASQGRVCSLGFRGADGSREDEPTAGKTMDRISKATTIHPEADASSADGAGHAECRQKLEAKARSFAMTLERHNSPNQYEAHFPQVSLSIAAGRAEVTSRAVVVITDKTSFTSPMPTHRGHPPPPPAPSGQGTTAGPSTTAAPPSPGSYTPW